ncbi:hypothetical protein OEZ85_010412 [Tetradesmus obliquus]|uniref:Mitochondrial splicing suppressor 51-like C-terminal domain-containing protein n=1 Tax=Tetradesmus obliquus TaxID=3088 RepID=A0ABY8TM97_TETOB|nr:hypothetical protein OEZ85_010412 [Tetradesmus obliquus]
MQLPIVPTTQQQWETAWAPLNPALLPSWGAVQQHAADSHIHKQQAQQQQQQQQQQEGEQQEQQVLQQLPCSWSEYYQLRGTPLESPAALALHFPLTLWHCLAQLLPAHGWPLPPPGQRITIAYLGPQSEVLLLPAFAELAALLPQHQLDIHMIGPDVPEQLHGKACTAAATLHGGLTVSCWAGCFHDILQDWEHAAAAAAAATAAAAAEPAPSQQTAGSAQGPTAAATAAAAEAEAAEDCASRVQQEQGEWGPAVPPLGLLHFVFAANAGLPAFPAWLPTLQQLLQLSKHGCSAQAAAQGPGDAAAGGSAGDNKTSSGSGRSSLKGPVPVLFSDYCEEAAVNSQQMVPGLLGCGFDLQCQLNPFRQPVGVSSHGTGLPACSNGFLFGWL